MNSFFNTGHNATHRLILALIISGILMFADHRLDSFGTIRTYLNSLVSPLQYVANIPSGMLNWSAQRLASQQQLLSENTLLKNENLLMRESVQQFETLKVENDRLRTLLGSPLQEGRRKMVAELMAVDNNPYSHQVIIDKGTSDGVFEGQPVLDANGIVGQVLHVAATTSRILLITDITHAVPVRVARNNVRLVASGSGELGDLAIHHMPHNTDLREGDLLISSGLGEVFPAGYPLAVVSTIIKDEGRPFATVNAAPIALLDRLKYLLLLWPTEHDERLKEVVKELKEDS
jgi:rod shape-determining protein MreC